jgi:hypothetical protein
MPSLFVVFPSEPTLFLSGSAVAIKRVFSSGRDLIGLHSTSLQPETSCTLMIVKACLRMARSAVIKLLGEDGEGL